MKSVFLAILFIFCGCSSRHLSYDRPHQYELELKVFSGGICRDAGNISREYQIHASIDEFTFDHKNEKTVTAQLHFPVVKTVVGQPVTLKDLSVSKTPQLFFYEKKYIIAYRVVGHLITANITEFDENSKNGLMSLELLITNPSGTPLIYFKKDNIPFYIEMPVIMPCNFELTKTPIILSEFR